MFGNYSNFFKLFLKNLPWCSLIRIYTPWRYFCLFCPALSPAPKKYLEHKYMINKCLLMNVLPFEELPSFKVYCPPFAKWQGRWIRCSLLRCWTRSRIKAVGVYSFIPGLNPHKSMGRSCYRDSLGWLLPDCFQPRTPALLSTLWAHPYPFNEIPSA